MGTSGGLGDNDVQLLDQCRHMGVFTWRKFIELHTPSAFGIYKPCLVSVLKMKLGSQQNLGSSNFDLYSKTKPCRTCDGILLSEEFFTFSFVYSIRLLSLFPDSHAQAFSSLSAYFSSWY